MKFFLTIALIFLSPDSFSLEHYPDIEIKDHIKQLYPIKYLQNEAISVVLDDKEPKYLTTLSYRLSQKIKKFSGEKKLNLVNKEDLTRHAYILFFTMRAYLNNLYCTVGHVIHESGIIAAATEANGPFLKLYNESKKKAEKIGKRWWLRKSYKNEVEKASIKAFEVYESEALKIFSAEMYPVSPDSDLLEGSPT